MKPEHRAYSVHLLTATGAVLAMLALLSAVSYDWPMMFLWLVVAFAVADDLLDVAVLVLRLLLARAGEEALGAVRAILRRLRSDARGFDNAFEGTAPRGAFRSETTGDNDIDRRASSWEIDASWQALDVLDPALAQLAQPLRRRGPGARDRLPGRCPCATESGLSASHRRDAGQPGRWRLADVAAHAEWLGLQPAR